MQTIREYFLENDLYYEKNGCTKPKSMITKERMSAGHKKEWIRRYMLMDEVK